MQKLWSVFWYNFSDSCKNSYLFTHCLLDQSLFLSFRHPSGPTTYFPDRSLLSSFSLGNDQPSIFVGILSIIFLSFFSFIVCMDIDGRWLLTIVRAGIPTIRPMVKLGRTMMISEDDDQFWRIRIVKRNHKYLFPLNVANIGQYFLQFGFRIWVVFTKFWI